MQSRGISRAFIWLGVIFLCVSALLGLFLHAVFAISPAMMLAIALLLPVVLYVLTLSMLSIGLLRRSRLQRPPAPPFRRHPPRGGDDPTGVREPRRPLLPSGTAAIAAPFADEEAP